MRRRSFLVLAATLPMLSLSRSAVAQTPAVTDDHTSLMSMLRLLPDDALEDDAWIRYGNQAHQLATMGVANDRDPQTWLDAIRELGVPAAMERALMDPIWRDSLGFDARGIDAFLERQSLSGSVTIMRGMFDAVIPARWTSMGYVPVETNGITWYTIGDANLLELDHYIHRLHLGHLRHLVKLDAGTVVGTNDEVGMERILALHAGASGSFADGHGAALATAPDDLVLATITGSAALVPDLDPELVARLPRSDGKSDAEVAAEIAQDREEAARMPQLNLALLGATAGWIRHAPSAGDAITPSRAVAVIVPEDPVDAEMVAETIGRRLTTQTMPESALIDEQSWVEAFPETVVTTASGGESVTVELTPVDGVPSTLLIKLRNLRHLPIFYWSGAEANADSG